MNEIRKVNSVVNSHNSKSINSCLVTLGVPYKECYIGNNNRRTKIPCNAQHRSIYESMTLDEIAGLADFYYNQKIQEWHPDKNPNNYDEATKMSQEINSAYDRVYTILKRRGYRR